MIKKLIKNQFVYLTIMMAFSSATPLIGAQILPALNEQSKLTLKLEKDEVAIFGYGSLMLQETLHTQEEEYKEPYIITAIKGFKRSWSVGYPNNYGFCFRDFNNEKEQNICFKPKTTLSLNVERSTNSKVNGLLFICSKNALQSYDAREYVYDRVKINDDLEDVQVIGGEAYVYTAKPEYYTLTENLEAHEAVIDAYYVGLIDFALQRMGKSFTEVFFETTKSIPEQLIKELLLENLLEEFENDRMPD